jgi:hypothetical protein
MNCDRSRVQLPAEPIVVFVFCKRVSRWILK